MNWSAANMFNVMATELSILANLSELCSHRRSALVEPLSLWRAGSCFYKRSQWRQVHSGRTAGGRCSLSSRCERRRHFFAGHSPLRTSCSADKPSSYLEKVQGAKSLCGSRPNWYFPKSSPSNSVLLLEFLWKGQQFSAVGGYTVHYRIFKLCIVTFLCCTSLLV